MSGLAPIKRKIFSIKHININAKIIPVKIPAHTQKEAILLARSLLPAPSAREIHDIAPAMKTIPAEINKKNTGPAIETAAICKGSFV